MADTLVARWSDIVDRSGECVPEAGEQQGRRELENAGYIREANRKR